MKKYLYIFVALFILVGGLYILTPVTYAECSPDQVPIGVEPIPPSISFSSVNVSADNLSVTVEGTEKMTIAACGQYEQWRSVVISGKILDNLNNVVDDNPFSPITIPAATSGDGYYSKTLPSISIGSLAPGAYKLKVTAVSGGVTVFSTAYFNKSGSIQIDPPLQTPPKPTITFGANYYNVGQGAGVAHNPISNNNQSGDPLIITWNSINASSCSKISGAGFETSGNTSGNDVPSALSGDSTFHIQCSGAGGTTDAEFKVVVVPNPTAQISVSPSGSDVDGFARTSGSFNFTWNGEGSSCSGEIDAGPLHNYTISGTSGNFFVNAWHDDLDYSGGNTPEFALIQATMTCVNSVGVSSPTASTQAKVFFDYLHWRGRIKPSCSSQTTSPMANLENQVSFSAERTKANNGGSLLWSNLNLYDRSDDRVWGIDLGHLPTYKVAKDTSGNDIVTPPTGYQYCGNTGPYTFNSNSNQIGGPDGSDTPNLPVIYLDFAPIGGTIPPTPTPPPTQTLTVDGIGECRQNYPDIQTQAYLTWNAIEGATSYEIYYDRAWPLSNVLKGTTSNLFYAVVYNPAEYNKSYDYFVIAKKSDGETITQSEAITPSVTPANCNEPPTNYISPTLDITPSEATILVGQTTQPPIYTSLYDPDGPDSRYGQFNVTDDSIWSSLNTTISTSLGNGIFQGNSIGTTQVKNKYVYQSSLFLTALAQLTVNNNDNGPDFSCLISPDLINAQKPTSVNYNVTVSSLNGFSGNVALSSFNLPSGITGSLAPVSVAVPSNGSATSVLTLNVSSSANIARSTFGVNCVSSTVTHSDQADINVTSPTAFSCSLSTDPSSGSSPLTVSTNISQQGGVSPYAYAYWCEKPWDPPANGTTQTGSCAYNANGTYELIGHVTDINGLFTSCTSTVAVGEIPPPPPTPTPPPGGFMSCTLLSANESLNQGEYNQLEIRDVTGSDDYSMTFYPERKTNPPSNGVGYLTSSNPFNHQYNTVGTFAPMAIVRDNTDPTKSGTCYSDGVTVNPSSPTCDLTASPVSIIYGGASKLSRVCNNFVPTTCFIDQGVGSISETPIPVKPKSNTTYTLTCSNAEGTEVTSTANVNVRGFLPFLREIIPR